MSGITDALRINGIARCHGSRDINTCDLFEALGATMVAGKVGAPHSFGGGRLARVFIDAAGTAGKAAVINRSATGVLVLAFETYHAPFGDVSSRAPTAEEAAAFHGAFR